MPRAPLSSTGQDNKRAALAFTPVIILGAGRSGTNVLRDVLTALPELGTWPCDEIQPIWRHGNLRWPDDAFAVDHARPEVKTFIQKQFHKQWHRLGQPAYLVEKTCANTLRVPFIDAIFPDARYIQIIRHGVNVVKSAEKRWRGEMEFPSFAYYYAKARFIPLMDMPTYLQAFISSRIGMLTGRAKQLSTWGPRFSGIDDLQGKNLPEICAQQWCTCVMASRDGLAPVDQKRRMTVYYEDLIQNPAKEVKKILEFLDVEYTNEQLGAATSIVRVEKARNHELSHCAPDIQNILAPCLAALGYKDKI